MSGFLDLQEVVEHDLFPEADLALRRGRHVGQDDGALYDFLHDAQDHLEPFYRRFGCELVRAPESYFYLLPSGDRLGRRVLSRGEMLVGQVLALLYLDPTSSVGGVVSREQLLGRLEMLVGAETLARTLNPRVRRLDERVAQETARTKVAEALRSLAHLGFVDLADGDRIRLHAALMRFTGPVRGVGDPADALARLVRTGEVVLPGSAGDEPDEEEEA